MKLIYDEHGPSQPDPNPSIAVTRIARAENGDWLFTLANGQIQRRTEAELEEHFNALCNAEWGKP